MLFLAAFGTVGYLTRRDLRIVARVSCIGLLVLIVFGIVLAFVNIPGGSAVYVVGGLAVLAGWTLVDFQKLCRAGNLDVIDLALSIYLDLINVFLFVLRVSE
jgi:FtsH-binding integral membrane protein